MILHGYERTKLGIKLFGLDGELVELSAEHALTLFSLLVRDREKLDQMMQAQETKKQQQNEKQQQKRSTPIWLCSKKVR